MTRRDVVLLGSTGSVGTQALDVIRRNSDRFRVVGLAAGGDSVDLLARQASEFAPEVVAVARATAAPDLQLAFFAEAQRRGFSAGQFPVPKILAGPAAATEVAAWPCDVVLNGISGSIGLAPTLAALDAGRTLALANKESLIVGGPLVKERAAPGQIVPVDSEHSALAQCLRGGRSEEVRRLVLTASGGPFRGRGKDDLGDVTSGEALAHPTWSMGPVVTVNSATMVNKGLEVLEAHLLFDIPLEQVDVVVHPQSVVHSMVEFADGSTLAQVSPPDMRLPIALGLSWPDRVPGVVPPCDWTRSSTWEFFPLDDEAFPAVGLARAAGRAGGVAPATYNAANEVCVAAFLAGRLRFPAIVDTVARVLEERPGAPAGSVLTLPEVLAAEDDARRRARELVGEGSAAVLMALGIILFLLGLLASIGLHEIGHLVPAKRSGVRVTQYMIGFGPTVWSRTKGDTEYGLKAIPLGGYIRMIGMFPPHRDGTVRSSSTGVFRQLMDDARHASAQEIRPGDESRVFYRLPVWRKIMIMLGGPSMNALIAVVLFTLALTTIGAATTSDSAVLGGVTRCLLPADDPQRTTCRDTDVKAPAHASDLRAGDRIVAADGLPVGSWSDLQNAIRPAADRPLTLRVQREDGMHDITVTPVKRTLPDLADPARTVSAGMIGITPVVDLERQPLTAVPGQLADIAGRGVMSVLAVPQRMAGVWKAAFGGADRDPEGPIGILGISRLGGEVITDPELNRTSKVGTFLELLAGLNLALFIFNLIPLLPLDGGHVAGALWEGLKKSWARVRRRPDPGFVDVARMLPVAYTVAILLVSMSALLLYADIVNPVRLRG